MSQRYEYNVGLRVHHPSMDPRVISHRLRMRADISWRVGEPRATPTGTPLSGTRADSYWSKTITPGWVRVPAGRAAADTLTRLMRRLRPHGSFLKRLRIGGGRVEIWLSSYSATNYAFVFTPSLIASLSALACELIVDVYPYKQRG